MKKNSLILILFSFCLTGCLSIDTNCCDKIFSEEIAKGIYLEKYRTFCAGVFGEVIECYVTDSTTFRYKIGSYDEHESFHVYLVKDKIIAYNLQSKTIYDTVERKFISKSQLWQYHHSDKNCLSTLPIFGTNTINCDSDYYPASSYRTNDGYIITQVQYRCGNEYTNAVYFTDSINFSVLIGIYNPGSRENNYSVNKINNESYAFYNITDIQKYDTLKVGTFLLTDLKKEKLIDVCKKK